MSVCYVILGRICKVINYATTDLLVALLNEHKYRRDQLDATNSDLLVINSISTCFGHHYAHHQEIKLRSTAYSCLSFCSCYDAGESGGKMCALCGEFCLTGNFLHTVHTSCHLTLQHHNSYNRTA